MDATLASLSKAAHLLSRGHGSVFSRLVKLYSLASLTIE